MNSLAAGTLRFGLDDDPAPDRLHPYARQNAQIIGVMTRWANPTRHCETCPRRAGCGECETLPCETDIIVAFDSGEQVIM